MTPPRVVSFGTTLLQPDVLCESSYIFLCVLKDSKSQNKKKGNKVTRGEYINPKCIRNGAGNEKKSRYTNHLHRVVYHRGIAATGFEKCVRFERWGDKFRKTEVISRPNTNRNNKLNLKSPNRMDKRIGGRKDSENNYIQNRKEKKIMSLNLFVFCWLRPGCEEGSTDLTKSMLDRVHHVASCRRPKGIRGRKSRFSRAGNFQRRWSSHNLRSSQTPEKKKKKKKGGMG